MNQRRVAFLGLMLAAGCSEGSKERPFQPFCRALAPSDAGPGDAQRLYPLEESARWFYRAGKGFGRVDAGAPVLLDGRPVTPLASSASGEASPFPSQHLWNGPSGISVHTTTPAAPPLDVAFPRLLVRWPVVAGDRYETLHCEGLAVNLDGDDRADRLDLTYTVEVGQPGPVATPIGRFEAYEVRTHIEEKYIDAAGRLYGRYDFHESLWLSPGIGPIQTGTIDARGVFTQGLRLVGYALAGERLGLQSLGSFPDYSEFVSLARGDAGLLAVTTSVGAWSLSVHPLDPEGTARGEPFTISPVGFLSRSPPVAAAGSTFLVARHATFEPLTFFRLDAAGAPLDAVGFEPGLKGWSNLLPLASDGETFGVIAADEAGPALVRIGQDGATRTATPLPGSWAGPVTLAWTGDHWLAAWVTEEGGLAGRRVDAGGTPLDPAPVPLSNAFNYRLVSTSREGVTLVVGTGPNGAVRALRVGADGRALDAEPIWVPAGQGCFEASVAPSASGFVIVCMKEWRQAFPSEVLSLGLRAYRISAAGTVIDVGDVLDLAEAGYGPATAIAGPDGDVLVGWCDGSCRVARLAL